LKLAPDDRGRFRAALGEHEAARRLRVPQEHPAAVYLASLALGSRVSMASALRGAAELLGSSVAELAWSRLTFGHMTGLRSLLVDGGGAPASANKMLCAVRGVLLAAVRLGKMEREAMIAAVAISPLRGHREAPGRSLAPEEIAAMVTACADKGLIGARDRALLALLFGGGLRRSEIVALDVAGVDELERDGELRVRGKGDKERRVALPYSVRRAVQAWLHARVRVTFVPLASPLFVRLAKGRLTSSRLSSSGVYFALARLAERAGVSHFSPHDLRRTYIGDLFDAGVDVATIQTLTGHASPATSTKYDRRPARARRDAAAKIGFPF
jgi:site-specific recombinase XerD